MTEPRFLAHSPSRTGREDTVADHLKSVAARAAEYASAFGADAAEEARLAGLLHDLGKYGEPFQRRLRGEAEHIDHWSAGAWEALMSYQAKGLATALAIQGHHIGLQWAESGAIRALNPDRLRQQHPLNLRLSEPPAGIITGLSLPVAALQPDSLYNHADPHAASTMLDVRMLFSALVDADFIETEAHFNASDSLHKKYRPEGPLLEPARALEVALAYIGSLAAKPGTSDQVKELRADLLRACLAAAEKPQGLFTLTAPTGSGKTIAMLAFALKHAVAHDLRRVVMVIPYLNIIDQTARVYRDIFQSEFRSDYVLEHHSLAGTRGEDEVADVGEDRHRETSENWDAPIVVTTSVQMLESLFANRPSACRKLHRLAKSVILFDEVQTMPTRLAVPTLAALSRLTERYAATVVFATATQPAFGHLDENVRKWCACGWQPTEVVPTELKLFDRARRTRVVWPDLERATSWDELAESLSAADCPQVLCVVNLKKHALALFRRLRDRAGSDDDLFHLSTSMCPAHRQVVLDEIRARLNTGRPCRFVSTQCVEAGVDVDFPVAYRAWGPLDSIAQVAGRCNRNGKLSSGTVHVFVPEDDRYPPGGYEQAAGMARVLFKGRPNGLDIDDPELYSDYYRQLYSVVRPEDRNEALMDAVKRQDFVEVARLYHLIPDATINVLVPHDMAAFEGLADDVRRDGITREWISRARPHTIGVYRPRRDAPITRWLEPVLADRSRASEDWFIYLKPEHYDPKTGLAPPESIDCLIG